MFSDILDSSKLKYNPNVIKTLFNNRGNSVVAKDDFYIMFPERYIGRNLASMGNIVNVLSIFAIVSKNMEYGVVSAPVKVGIIPSNVTNLLVDGVVNKVLEIQKGSVFIPTRDLVRSTSFMYDLFNEFFLQGKVPWFLSYDRLSDIFLGASKYAGSNIGNDPLAIEIITSLVSRDKENKLINFRSSIKSKKYKRGPAYIGLNNVFYSYDNTLSKVMGGYMQLGVTTAIVNPETNTTEVSALLRK